MLKIGDKVKLNKNATIKDIIENDWHGCQLSTLNFIENHADDDDDTIYTVTNVFMGDVHLDGNGGLINSNILILVERPKKKMTVKEICEELGYDVEIIKED